MRAIQRLQAEPKWSTVPPEISFDAYWALLTLEAASPTNVDSHDLGLKYNGKSQLEYRSTGGRGVRWKGGKCLMEYAKELVIHGTDSLNTAFGREILQGADASERSAKLFHTIGTLISMCCCSPSMAYDGCRDAAGSDVFASFREDSEDSEFHTPSEGDDSSDKEFVVTQKRRRITQQDVESGSESEAASEHEADDDYQPEAGAGAAQPEPRASPPRARPVAAATIEEVPEDDQEESEALDEAGRAAPDASEVKSEKLRALLDSIWPGDKPRRELLQHFRDRLLPASHKLLDVSCTSLAEPPTVPLKHQAALDFVRDVNAQRTGPLPELDALLAGGEVVADDFQFKPFQVDAVRQLLNLMLGSRTAGKAIDGSPMGTGKTAKAILAAAYAHRAKRCGAALVLCPPAMVREWECEVLRVLKRARVFRVQETRLLRERWQDAAAAAAEDRACLVFLVVASQCLSRAEHVRALHRFRDMSRPMLIVDEYHLNCRDPSGTHGQAVSGLLRHNTAAAPRGLRPLPALLLSGTPLCGSSRHEALDILTKSLGLFGCEMGSEAFTQEDVAQNLLRMLVVRAENPDNPVPPFQQYCLYVPSAGQDEADEGAVRCRKNRCGNRLSPLDFPPATFGLLAASARALRGYRTLAFYDTVEGVKELQGVVEGLGHDVASRSLFLHGGLSNAEQEVVYSAVRMLQAGQGCAVYSTVGMCSVGVNCFAQRGFDHVYFLGKNLFSVSDEVQAIARLARPPNARRVLSVEFACVDEDTMRTDELRRHKVQRTSQFTNARERSEARKAKVRAQAQAVALYEDLAPFLAGAEALGEAGLAASALAGKFEATACSRLQPPRDRKELQAHFASLRKAIEDAMAAPEVGPDLPSMAAPAPAPPQVDAASAAILSGDPRPPASVRLQRIAAMGGEVVPAEAAAAPEIQALVEEMERAAEKDQASWEASKTA